MNAGSSPTKVSTSSMTPSGDRVDRPPVRRDGATGAKMTIGRSMARNPESPRQELPNKKLELTAQFHVRHTEEERESEGAGRMGFA